MAQENLLEITPIVHEALTPQPFQHVVVGGLVSDALLSEGATIDSAEKIVYVPPDSVVPSVRANGTARDVDILALTDTPEHVTGGLNALAAAAMEAFPRTVISLSGYDTEHCETVPQFITRTVVGDADTLVLSMGDVLQEVPRRHLEDVWALHYRGRVTRILHPAVHVMSYKTRSITGLRRKDMGKVGLLEAVVNRHISAQERAEFQPWEHFAASIEATYSLKGMLANPSFRRSVMVVGRAGLGAAERSPVAVTLAQNTETPFAKFVYAALSRSKPGLRTNL